MKNLLKIVLPFARNSNGNVAMMFGFSLIPILGGAGVAIDYSRASNLQSTLQSAVDSTVLAIARPGKNMTDAQLLALAQAHFRAIVTDVPELATTNPTVTRGVNTISVKATAQSKTSFMQILGSKTPMVSALAQIATKQNKAELALVLDNTGSMSRLGKMDELKRATINLLNAAEASAPTGSGLMRVSLVPFSTQVKIDPNVYRNSSWLAYSSSPVALDASFNPIRARMSLSPLLWGGCIENRGAGFDSNDQPTNNAQPNSYFPAMNCSTTLAPVQTLTDNWNQLRSIANSMTPSGNTNIILGARVGLATLANSGPIGGGSPNGTPSMFKYMILLTDGNNTQDRFNDVSNGIGSAAAMDAKSLEMCTAIKTSAATQGIKLYTVRVIEGNQAMLTSCASSPQLYKEVTVASDIDKVFKEILRDITNLRLSM
jgi:Flp pilus assembly protein TadG